MGKSGNTKRMHMTLAVVCGLAACSVHAQDAAAARELFQQALALENGEGVARDPLQAANLYCLAARMGDAEAPYNLGWMYANGRGIARNDAMAGFFFKVAAAKGIDAAQRMLKVVGEPLVDTPECMREPAVPVSAPAQQQAAVAAPRVDYKAIAPRKIFDLVTSMAPQFKIEPQLVLAIIAAESNFNSLAVSTKSAQGLMQLIPETSERFNVKNAFDPAQNIRGGLTYLRWLLAYFEGDVALVAAAYNAGEGTVDRYSGVPPYMETRSYVKRILASFGALVHPFDERVTRPSPVLKKLLVR